MEAAHLFIMCAEFDHNLSLFHTFICCPNIQLILCVFTEQSNSQKCIWLNNILISS